MHCEGQAQERHEGIHRQQVGGGGYHRVEFREKQEKVARWENERREKLENSG